MADNKDKHAAAENISQILNVQASYLILLFLLLLTIAWIIEPPHEKPTKWAVRPAKTQISLGIRPLWSESS